MLKIQSFIAPDGERFSQIYENDSGFPLFYPTAYCSRYLRTRYTHSTQKEHLFAIKKFYEWANSLEINLSQRLGSRVFFTAGELDSLANWVSLKKGYGAGGAISGEKINACLTAISRYLSWHADEIITDSNRPEIRTAIDHMTNALKARHVRQESISRKAQRILDKRLPDEMRAELEKIFNLPLNNVKKLADHGPNFRNILALRILYETGMRVGEMLSLTLADFHPTTGGDHAMLEIRRNHNDAFDDRIRQPVAKTNGRHIPISQGLSDFISTYLKQWRHKVPNVGFENRDFLLITHRKGKRQGGPLQYSALESGIANLKRNHPSLRGLHPHLLRHDWNYRFSLFSSQAGYLPAKEQAAREFLMGWVPGSESAKRYNLRHIRESAFKIGLQVASHTVERRLKDE